MKRYRFSQYSAMEDFDPPSFSLGLDFDLNSDPGSTPRAEPVSRPVKRPSAVVSLRTINEDGDDFESPVRVSEPQASEKFPALKRIRRGPTSQPTFEARNAEARCNIDDDIENFSSEEDSHRVVGNISTHSTCSSSKSSLHKKKILTSESANKPISRKKREFSTASAHATKENTNINFNNVMFPELTVSPLRRFQLIDSDSDEPPVSDNKSKNFPYVNLSSKENQSSNTKVGKYQTGDDDLWKDFCSEKSSHIPTPAFDEICKEYYSSAEKKTETEVKHKDASNNTERLPAHYYFFHKDPRIQKLVRDRLPNFFPLGSQKNASIIDYMGQFGGHEGSSRQNGGKNSIEKSSARTKKNDKKSQVENVSVDSENWVTPKSCEGLPKDAGKRRVQAVGKSAGHWHTGSDGKRVFVNKGGQELTGRMAYMQYKKESGKGFKNKKQTGTKKKAAMKRKSAPKK